MKAKFSSKALAHVYQLKQRRETEMVKNEETPQLRTGFKGLATCFECSFKSAWQRSPKKEEVRAEDQLR